MEPVNILHYLVIYDDPIIEGGGNIKQDRDDLDDRHFQCYTGNRGARHVKEEVWAFPSLYQVMLF